MLTLTIGFLALAVPATASAQASELEGPARFCGYSPIIDLIHGEKITTIDGGIHGGRFRWAGAFGEMEVHGSGWARRPKGRIIKAYSTNGPAQFAPRRLHGSYQIAIWNGSKASAYFISTLPFTTDQLRAIDRVRLYEEGQTPDGCSLRTVFAVE